MSLASRVLRSGHPARRWLGTAGLLAAFVLGLPACERKGEQAPAGSTENPKIGILPEGAAKPNIIMILVDTLRADRVGAYGHRGLLTPTMDTIAAAGVTFDYCVAPAPWTLPSVATLFTSYYPGVHKATDYEVVADMEDGKQAHQSMLSDEFDTLAEVLRQHGYQTAGFCAARFLRAEYGFGQGFEHFDTSFADNTVPGAVVNAALFKWLEESRDGSRPLFLYLHYMDVHGPYNAAPRFMDPLMERVEANPNKQLLDSRQFKAINAYLCQPPPEASDPGQFERLKGYRDYWVARYEAGVAEMDFYLSQLVAQLKTIGLWEDAYVIFLADHGEALCEHGIWCHGYSQYQTDLHVPLILRWPSVLPPGTRVRRLASLIDLMPTLLEQLRLPPGEGLQGVSLVDHISDRLPDMALARFAEGIKAGPQRFAVFADQTKLIVTLLPTRTAPDGTVTPAGVRRRLFNLATDPYEQFDVSAQNPEQVKLLTKLFDRMLRTNMATKPGLVVPRGPVDAESIRRLEALGYAGGQEDEEEDEASDLIPTSQPASAPATSPDEGGDEPNEANP